MSKKIVECNECIELKFGKIPFDSFHIYINPRAQKMYAGLVVEYNTDKKYPIQLEWLEKTWVDDVLHYESNKLSVGDYIKVNGGSYKNRRTAYFKILSINSKELCLKLVTENQVIENFSDKARHFKRDIKNKVNDTKNEELLEKILKLLDEDIAKNQPEDLPDDFDFNLEFDF